MYCVSKSSSPQARTGANGLVWATVFALAVGLGAPAVAGDGIVEKREKAQAATTQFRSGTDSEVSHADGEAVTGNQADEALTRPETPGNRGTVENAGTARPEAAAVGSDGDPWPLLRSSDGGAPVIRTNTQRTVAEAGSEPSDGEIAANEGSGQQEAQFQLPAPTPEGEAPKAQLPQRLTFQYGYGSESEMNWRKNADLNDDLRDNSFTATPQLNGTITYRPTAWLETTVELTAEREFPIDEESAVTLPDGDIEKSENRQFSLLFDQAFVTIRDFTDPFEFTVGRRNFEDDRHFLFDTSIDGVVAGFRHSALEVEAAFGRESWVDGDIFANEETNRINTYMLLGNYRGFRNINLSGYAIYRDDRFDREEGQPWWVGLSSRGLITNSLSYWSQLAYMGGEDEASRTFSAYAFDVGLNYQFPEIPLNPNFTVGFAYATGDGSGSGTNHEFRQTGLQSNETRFAGIPEFKVYGEALDPELSNIQILTAGVGVRPSQTVSLDFVYHYYWFEEIAGEVRNSGLTAITNEDDESQSKQLGSALDIVLGFRNVFGLRRLGMDLRAGLFFPGTAFKVADGAGFREADKGLAMVVKFWW